MSHIVAEVSADAIADELFYQVPYIGLYTTEPQQGYGLLDWIRQRSRGDIETPSLAGDTALVLTQRARTMAAGSYPIFVSCVQQKADRRMSARELVHFLQGMTPGVRTDYQAFFTRTAGEQLLIALMRERYRGRQAARREDPSRPVVVTDAVAGQTLVSVRFALAPLPAVDIFAA